MKTGFATYKLWEVNQVMTSLNHIYFTWLTYFIILLWGSNETILLELLCINMVASPFSLLLVIIAQGSSLALHTLPGRSCLFPHLHPQLRLSSWVPYAQPNSYSTSPSCWPYVIFNTSKIKSVLLCTSQTLPSVIYPITINSQKENVTWRGKRWSKMGGRDVK